MFDSRRTRRHRAQVALADDQLCAPRCEPLQERRDLGWFVLTVRVERHDRRRACIERIPEPGTQGGALARVGDLGEHRGAGRARSVRGIVVRAVVDHHDGQVPARGLHDRPDAWPFVVGGNQRDDGPVRGRHRQSIVAAAILMTDSGTASTLHHSPRLR